VIGRNQEHPDSGIPASGGDPVTDQVTGSQAPPPLPPQAPVPKEPLPGGPNGSNAASASTFFAGLTGQTPAESGFGSAVKPSVGVPAQGESSRFGGASTSSPISGKGGPFVSNAAASHAAPPPDAAGRGFSQQAELYAELFGVAPAPRQTQAAQRRQKMLKQVQAPPPPSPGTLRESGLNANQVAI